MTSTIKQWLKANSLVLLLLPLIAAGATAAAIYLQDNGSEQVLGGNYDGSAKWYVYNTFTGYQTKLDPAKVDDGANPQGQNTTVNEGDRISIRNFGYETYPAGASASTTGSPITSVHTFRKRDGTNILMRSYADKLEYFDEGTDAWVAIKWGLTSGKKFGYADYNINTDQTSYVYFGNAYDNFMRWTGARSIVASAPTAGNTLYLTSVDGFSATGSVFMCGAYYTYSAVGTTSLNLSPPPGGSPCTPGTVAFEMPQEYPWNPKGNIYLAAQNRIFISGSTSTPQAVYFSRYGDARDYYNASLISGSTAASPGIFNLAEGGGGVSGMVLDENSIYIFKKSIIYKATLSDSLYALQPLKPFDGKSQTIGAVTNFSTFTGGNGVFFITPDKQILNLARVEGVDYPQVKPISDIIKPTTDAMDFSQASGIVFQDRAFFSVKSASSTPQNDVILTYNIKNGYWDSPIVGWQVSDFTVYDDGNGEALYLADATAPNIYKVTNAPLDGEFAVKANWRSKQIDFGLPQSLKEIQNVYVEGYIAQNVNLSISLLLDENGYNQTLSTTFNGSESAYIYNSENFNLFGFSPFGYERFGTGNDLTGKRKFRVYLNKGLRVNPFYNAQLEFASEGENDQWEITGYGFYVRPYSLPEKRELYRDFK